MQLTPKTISGLAPFIMATFVIAILFFLDYYGWYNFSKWFDRNNTES